jgi:hypothetical protein
VALHSARGSSRAVGDALVDRSDGDTTLEIGVSRVIADGVAYVVSGSRIVEKGELGEQADAWNGSSDLIVITCSQRSDGRPSELLLTFAMREQRPVR